MPEPDDPLRTLFQQAALAGQARARTAPVAHVRARGRRAHRLRVAALAAGACLVLGCGTAATAAWLPGESAPAAPATRPPSPAPTPSPTTTPPPAHPLATREATHPPGGSAHPHTRGGARTTAPPPGAPSGGSTADSSDGPSPPDGTGRTTASATLPPSHPPTHDAGDTAH
ncbi:hypothetical protein AB0F42_25515 [Streptomyces buecherae]|uniref:hypothetical protein n=1 Tax=Streptomyces buecherae TaxID=2763006 RepID=UPI003404F736